MQRLDIDEDDELEIDEDEDDDEEEEREEPMLQSTARQLSKLLVPCGIVLCAPPC